MIVDNINTMDDLAHCFDYPDSGTPECAKRAASSLAPLNPRSAQALEKLGSWIESNPIEAEEHYTKLFDLDPACTLHVGYHLFGEDYQRGALLAQLRVELRTAGVEENNDLPDFLPLLLRLLPRLGSDEDRAALTNLLLLPAIDRMVSDLGRVQDPFAELVRSLALLLGASSASSASEEGRAAGTQERMESHA